MRRRARVDANQAEVVDVFRSLGATWQSTHTVPGALDGIVGVAGIDQRVEIKDGSKPPSARVLTDAESDVFRDWRGRPPVIISTRAQAVKLVEMLRAEARRRAWRDE